MATKAKKNRLHFDKFIVTVFAVVLVGLVGAGYIAASQAAKPAATATIELLNPGVKLGEYAKFATTINGSAKNPRVVVNCYQEGEIVYGVNEDPVVANTTGIKLGGDSSPWKNAGGGIADCKASVATYVYKSQQWTVTTLASTNFTVTE